MAIFTVNKRFGNAHSIVINSIEAETSKEAFIIALEKYYEESNYAKYTAFYVQTFDKNFDSIDCAYGYSNVGQKELYGKGIMMS